jgi:hypothetical protein
MVRTYRCCTSCLPSLSTLTLLELSEQPTGLGDFPLLAPILRIVTLVVAAEEQDHLVGRG